MKESSMESFITRHSISPTTEDKESPEYPGISEKGVELAVERAREISNLIEKAEAGSVIFIGGSSELTRTKSTANVYGVELKKLFDGRDDVQIINSQDIEDIKNEGGKSLDVIAEEIKVNKDKKIVVDFPFFMKELSILKRWTEDGKSYAPFFQELLKKNNNDYYATARDWYQINGEFNGIQGPKPLDVAQEYLHAIERLKEFAVRQIGERPLVIGMVGHSFDIDALVAYLANNGNPTIESFDMISQGSLIKETEIVKIDINKNSESLMYRGKQYLIGINKSL